MVGELEYGDHEANSTHCPQSTQDPPGSNSSRGQKPSIEPASVTQLASYAVPSSRFSLLHCEDTYQRTEPHTRVSSRSSQSRSGHFTGSPASLALVLGDACEAASDVEAEIRLLPLTTPLLQGDPLVRLRSSHKHSVCSVPVTVPVPVLPWSIPHWYVLVREAQPKAKHCYELAALAWSIPVLRHHCGKEPEEPEEPDMEAGRGGVLGPLLLVAPALALAPSGSLGSG